MSGSLLRDALTAFGQVDLAAWHGLPPTDLDEVAAHLVLAREVVGRGRLGSEDRAAGWVAVDSPRYESGLRVWTDDDGGVLLLEGRHPLTPDDEPAPAPPLGTPELTLPARLGRLVLDDAEHVHPERGLAVQVNPDNGLLLAVVGFAPTTIERYLAVLRPDLDAFGPPLQTPPYHDEAPGAER